VDANRQALGWSPNVPEVRYNLGGALERLGRKAEAIEAYRQVLEGRFAASSWPPATDERDAPERPNSHGCLISRLEFPLCDRRFLSAHRRTARLLSDLSNTVLLVAQTDVVSLWSANRLRTFLEEGTGRDRVRLVLNRYKKIPGFSDEDVETATNAKLLWKLPNNYQAIAPAIDKGTPVVFQANEDISRSFRSLAATLAEAAPSSDGSLDLAYKHDKAGAKEKGARRLLISPLRAGQ